VAIVLALLLSWGALELHRAEHGVTLEGESSVVLASARHHQDPAHLEDAELSHRAECPACLLLKSPSRIAAPRALALEAGLGGQAVPAPVSGPREASPLLHGSRGPPLS
jgi:hypothetical protein